MTRSPAVGVLLALVVIHDKCFGWMMSDDELPGDDGNRSDITYESDNGNRSDITYESDNSDDECHDMPPLADGSDDELPCVVFPDELFRRTPAKRQRGREAVQACWQTRTINDVADNKKVSCCCLDCKTAFKASDLIEWRQRFRATDKLDQDLYLWDACRGAIGKTPLYMFEGTRVCRKALCAAIGAR